MPDTLTPAQRRKCMQSVRTRGTGIERIVGSALHQRGYRFRKNVRSLPGSPDLVLARYRVAIFVDGDFWHGYRFPLWQHTVSQFWVEKIEKNRRRDQRSFRRLRKAGWRVLRIWEHEIEHDLSGVLARITACLKET
jgi:DNA mismatch endonuclease (patch repair protein)